MPDGVACYQLQVLVPPLMVEINTSGLENWRILCSLERSKRPEDLNLYYRLHSESVVKPLYLMKMHNTCFREVIVNEHELGI